MDCSYSSWALCSSIAFTVMLRQTVYVVMTAPERMTVSTRTVRMMRFMVTSFVLAGLRSLVQFLPIRSVVFLIVAHIPSGDLTHLFFNLLHGFLVGEELAGGGGQVLHRISFLNAQGFTHAIVSRLGLSAGPSGSCARHLQPTATARRTFGKTSLQAPGLREFFASDCPHTLHGLIGACSHNAAVVVFHDTHLVSRGNVTVSCLRQEGVELDLVIPN